MNEICKKVKYWRPDQDPILYELGAACNGVKSLLKDGGFPNLADMVLQAYGNELECMYHEEHAYELDRVLSLRCNPGHMLLATILASYTLKYIASPISMRDLIWDVPGIYDKSEYKYSKLEQPIRLAVERNSILDENDVERISNSGKSGDGSWLTGYLIKAYANYIDARVMDILIKQVKRKKAVSSAGLTLESYLCSLRTALETHTGSQISSFVVDTAIATQLATIDRFLKTELFFTKESGVVGEIDNIKIIRSTVLDEKCTKGNKHTIIGVTCVKNSPVMYGIYYPLYSRISDIDPVDVKKLQANVHCCDAVAAFDPKCVIRGEFIID